MALQKGDKARLKDELYCEFDCEMEDGSSNVETCCWTYPAGTVVDIVHVYDFGNGPDGYCIEIDGNGSWDIELDDVEPVGEVPTADISQ